MTSRLHYHRGIEGTEKGELPISSSPFSVPSVPLW